MSQNFNLPETGLDLLADLVSDSHAGSIYRRGWYTGPWNLRFGALEDRGFHIVTVGTVYVRTPRETLVLGPGDIILLSVPHELATDLDAPPLTFEPTMGLASAEGGGDTCLLCGAYQLHDAAQHPVFSNLPEVVLLRAGERDPAIDALVSVLDREFRSHGPGGRAIASRLIDAMLVYILRHWIEHECPTALGWLRALRDPVLARALALLHTRFDEPWPLERLARAAGTSRATLLRGFQAEVGRTPTQFLTARRLAAAASMLERTSMSLEEIATHVGYGSAFSFSKAFKRERGVAPSSVRATAYSGTTPP